MSSVQDKLLRLVSKTVAAVTGSLAQTEVCKDADRTPFPGMPALVRETASAGAVLLRNDGCLPFVNRETLAVFGRVQLDWFAVGYGSGGDVNAPYTTNLLDGLRACEGLSADETLAGVYEEWVRQNPAAHGFWGHWPRFHPEMPLSDEALAGAAARADAAVVVIGRSAGEDRENTLEKGSWYLTDDEESLLTRVTAVFRKTVVVLNIGSMIDLTWTKQTFPHDVAVLVVWQGGMESGNAVADLLSGRQSPGGRLTDTAAAYEAYPSAKSFGNRAFNNYSEDIYVGYRWFETFCPEKTLYPFGFGLGYTDFSIQFVAATSKGDRTYLRFDVKNTGEKFSGREVVQVYCEAPQGVLGKPARCLCGFAKTELLAPGVRQEVTIEVPDALLASYDDTGKTGFRSAFVLEAGIYRFYAGSNVRTAEFIWSFTLDKISVTQRLSEVAAAKKAFARVVPVRRDSGYAMATEQVPVASVDLKKRILDNLPWAVVTTGDRGIRLRDVRDGRSDMKSFVAQLNLKELEAISRGDYTMNSPLGAPGNAGVFGGVLPSLRDKGIPPITCTDGPSGIRLNACCSLLPIGTLLACTWDTPLLERLCTLLGREMRQKGADVLLAPGLNLHRNPLCGRNFEYFSEDPLLSGKCAAAYVRGVQTAGVAACPKHFACNNQETNRNYNDSRLSERALRELYLKGFELCVKEAAPRTIMTSYNKINGVWGHYHYELCATVLRGEWKFKGLVITDWWMRSARSPEFPRLRDNAYRVRAGVDVLMPGGKRGGKRRPDGTLLRGHAHGDGITLGELQRVARHVLRFCLESMENDG